MYSLRRLLRRCVFAPVTLALLLTQPGNAEDVPSLTVCQLFENFYAFSGKLIAVRGQLYYGREDFEVGEQECPVAFETPGHKWPTAIYLRGPSPDAPKDGADPRSLKFIDGLVSLLINVYMRGDHPDFTPLQISATFVGVLHTHSVEDLASHKFAGFGQVGRYPAELDLIAVRDVRITGLEAKTSDSKKPQVGPVLGVCDVFRDLRRLFGQAISVRAELSVGAHDAGLVQPNCELALLWAGRKWPTAISLEDPPLPAYLADIGVDNPDPRSVAFVKGLSRLLRFTYVLGNPPTAPFLQVSATFIGVFRTAFSWPGFGDGGLFPAGLEFIAVKDLMITGLASTNAKAESAPK